jgi:hypothetical protein
MGKFNYHTLVSGREVVRYARCIDCGEEIPVGDYNNPECNYEDYGIMLELHECQEVSCEA